MSDLISRKALLESLEKEQQIYKDIMVSPPFWTALSVVRHMPPVEAIPVVHGEWKEATPKGVHSWSKGYARCSACDETIWSGWEMNFCPNCGADMRKKV